MEITQIKKYGIVCIAVKIDTEAELTQRYEELIKKILKGDKRRLLFDLGTLQYLRSSVLRAILKAVKEINQNRGKVVLCSQNGYVKEIFDVNRVNNSIPITNSVESGLNALLSP
jgi:anti-anti-sigma factor